MGTTTEGSLEGKPEEKKKEKLKRWDAMMELIRWMDRRSGVFYREEELTVGREGACRTVTVGGGETCRDNRRSKETLQRGVKSRFQSDQLIVQLSSSQFLCFPWGPLGSKVLELLGD